jgi:hypothetical protein
MLTAIQIKVRVEGERAESILARLSAALRRAPDRNIPQTAQFVLDDYESAPEAIAAVREALDNIDPGWDDVLLLR